MAGNIIPAIATTNAMTAGLCVMQAFKVMRDDYDKAKMVFLTRSTDRVLTAEQLHTPKPDCPVCSVAQTRLVVDTSRATLKDLVEDFLRLQLGYGEEFSVSSDAGVIYDPELDDNLPKKFSEIGLKADSFVTVIDEEDENPRVNLVLSISEQYVLIITVLVQETDHCFRSLPEDAKPIHLSEKLDIPHKPKAVHEHATETNGHEVAVTNGVDSQRKRTAEDAGLDDDQLRKRGKVAEGGSSVPKAVDPEEIIVIDDNAPITIDD